MYPWLVIFLLSIELTPAHSQTIDFQIYKWEEVLQANPDSIFGLSFSKEKRSELPVELSRFTRLRYLDISKNKFKVLPDFLDSLKNLEVFIGSKNDFDIFPLLLTRIEPLKNIILNRNGIEQVPELIQTCKNLQKLDLSDNPIVSLPISFFTLENLKVVDLTGVRFGPRYQTYIKNMRTDIEWILDPPCDCME